MREEEASESVPMSGKPLIGIRVFSAFLLLMAFIAVALFSSSGMVESYGTGKAAPAKEVVTARLFVSALKTKISPETSKFYEIGEANSYPAAGVQSDCPFSNEGLYGAQLTETTNASIADALKSITSITFLSNGTTLVWKLPRNANTNKNQKHFYAISSIPGITSKKSGAFGPIGISGYLDSSKGKTTISFNLNSLDCVSLDSLPKTTAKSLNYFENIGIG